MIWPGLTFLALLIWLVIATARGRFWLCRERDDLEDLRELGHWPSVIAIVPARNEADGIARSIRSLIAQDYPGAFRIIVIDDQSEDATAAVVQGLKSERVQLISGAAHPPGWTGKLYAVSLGVAAAGATDYLWLTDADIAHAPDTLRSLVARAERSGLVLTSLMARLNCESFAEKLLVPAFVFYFALLFPFAWVNKPRAKTVAAAGGCMLVRRAALEQAGGIAAIRGAIIDDCTLGRALKRQGPIWLGLTNRSVSIRPYPRLSDIGAMVSRSAYAQLGFSPLALLGTILGMVLLYVVPVAGFFAGGLSAVFGALTWALMTVLFQPILYFYRRTPFWGLALPLIGVLYAAFTLESAVQHWQGRGGMWKGRAQAIES
jgi:hopene-associated glycosyltransferase HpnB